MDGLLGTKIDSTYNSSMWGQKCTSCWRGEHSPSKLQYQSSTSNSLGKLHCLSRFAGQECEHCWQVAVIGPQKNKHPFSFRNSMSYTDLKQHNKRDQQVENWRLSEKAKKVNSELKICSGLGFLFAATAPHLSPAWCQKLIDSDGALGICKRRTPISPNPPWLDLCAWNDEASEHEDNEKRQASTCISHHHCPTHTSYGTKHCCWHLMSHKQQQILPEKPAMKDLSNQLEGEKSMVK